MLAKMEEDEGSRLFEDLKVFVIGSLDDATSRGLSSGKCHPRSYLSGLLNLIIVGKEPPESELSEAWEIYEDIPLVRQDWITCSLQANKRLPLEPFALKSDSLFRGLKFSIARGELSQEDVNILWELLTFNGCLAVSLELHAQSDYAINTRVVDFKGPSLVTPDWVVDSVKDKELKDPKFYHPKLLLKPGEVYLSKRQALLNQIKEEGLPPVSEETPPTPPPVTTTSNTLATQGNAPTISSAGTTTTKVTLKEAMTPQFGGAESHGGTPPPKPSPHAQRQESPSPHGSGGGKVTPPTPVTIQGTTPSRTPTPQTFVHATKSSGESLVVSRASTPSPKQTVPQGGGTSLDNKQPLTQNPSQPPTSRSSVSIQQVSNNGHPQQQMVVSTTLQSVQPTVLQTVQANTSQPTTRPTFISVSQSQAQALQRGQVHATLQRPLQQSQQQGQLSVIRGGQVLQGGQQQSLQQAQTLEQQVKVASSGQPQQIQIQPIQQIQVSQNGQTIQHVQLSQAPQSIQISQAQSIQVSQHQQVQIAQQGQQPGGGLRQVQLSQQQQQQGQALQTHGTIRQVQLTQQHVHMPQQIQISQQQQQQVQTIHQGQTVQVQLPQQVQVSQQGQQHQGSQPTIQHVHLSQQQVSQQSGQQTLTRVAPRTIQGQQLIHAGQIQTIRPQQQGDWQGNQVQQQVIQQRPTLQESNMPQQQQSQVIQQLSVQQGNPTIIRQSHPQAIIAQGQTQTLMRGGQQHIIQRARQPSPHILRQQQIIQQHIAGLSMEQRASFTQMNPREKQQYLAARGLLLPHPTIRHTITLTDQQREMLQNMDGQQRQVFIAKLQKEKEIQIRQQMIQRQQQQQQQQQQQGMVQQQQVMVSQQQQQQMWQQQQPNQQQQQYRAVSHSGESPSIGVGSNVQAQNPGGMRPTWSGEAHPALAQVPRTPQQMQRLQRLQLQREQQQGGGIVEAVNQQQQQQPRQQLSNDPRPQMTQQMLGQQQGVPPQQAQAVVSAQSQVQIQQAPAQQYMQQQITMQQQQGGNGGNQTKVALANMLTNRLQQPGASSAGVPGALTPQSAPHVPPQGTVVNPQQQGAPGNLLPASGKPQAMSVGQQQDPGVTRVHMMNLQQQQQAQQQIGPSGYVAQQQGPAGAPQYFNVQQQQPQQRRTLDNVTNTNPQQHVAGPPGSHQNQIVSCGAGGGMVAASRFPGGVRMGIPRPGAPIHHPPRIQFYGHDPKLTLPADLCLLGCIFIVGDYHQSEESDFLSGWTRVIKQYGGEVEEEYHPRITHVLCRSQDNPIAQQGLREGKRLVTVYWLNDIVVNKRVSPPWKAIHFPLPINFEKPCENMLLTLTGFEGRDRDWVKQMIKLSGAKFSGYFSRHNHAIVCKKPSGQKYEKAKEWKVPAVSVQWLNDVLFGNVNAVQCVNNPKYQNLKMEDPFRVDFSLLPHLMEAWKIPIRVTPETYQKFKANPPARIKRKVEKQKQEKEEAAKRLRLEQEGGGVTNGSSTTNNETSPPSEASSGAMNGEGSHDGSQPGAPGGGTTSSTSDSNNEDEKENSLLGSNDNTEGGGGDGDSKKIPVLLSGFHKSDFSNMLSLIKEVPSLYYTSDVSTATHLVMPKLCRTINFLKAVVKVKYILSYDWLKDSAKEKSPQDEGKYIFKDEEFERTFKFSLSSTLAAPNRDKLFEGKTFYITPETPPSLKKLKSLIELAGGRVENHRLKDLKHIKELNKPGAEPNYIIITCELDLHLVTEVLKAKIGVYNGEFVLSAVMRNKMNFDLSRYITTV